MGLKGDGLMLKHLLQDDNKLPPHYILSIGNPVSVLEKSMSGSRAYMEIGDVGILNNQGCQGVLRRQQGRVFANFRKIG